MAEQAPRPSPWGHRNIALSRFLDEARALRDYLREPSHYQVPRPSRFPDFKTVWGSLDYVLPSRPHFELVTPDVVAEQPEFSGRTRLSTAERIMLSDLTFLFMGSAQQQASQVWRKLEWNSRGNGKPQLTFRINSANHNHSGEARINYLNELRSALAKICAAGSIILTMPNIRADEVLSFTNLYLDVAQTRKAVAIPVGAWDHEKLAYQRPDNELAFTSFLAQKVVPLITQHAREIFSIDEVLSDTRIVNGYFLQYLRILRGIGPNKIELSDAAVLFQTLSPGLIFFHEPLAEEIFRWAMQGVTPTRTTHGKICTLSPTPPKPTDELLYWNKKDKNAVMLFFLQATSAPKDSTKGLFFLWNKIYLDYAKNNASIFMGLAEALRSGYQLTSQQSSFLRERFRAIKTEPVVTQAESRWATTQYYREPEYHWENVVSREDYEIINAALK